MRKGYRQLLAEANALVEAVPVAQAAALAGDADTVFVDLRDPREVERDGGIPGARHCPRGMLEFWIDPESPYHKSWFAGGQAFLFYCASGWRSALAARTAQEMGLARVRHLEGGFGAWRKAGLPTDGGPARQASEG